MHKRWCIISGPRTGSTYLENMIFQYWKEKDPTSISLGEILNPDFRTTKYSIEIDSSGCLFQNKEKIMTKLKSDDLIKHVTDLILASNIDQPIVFKVFTQYRHYTEKQYLDFFKRLETVGFKFISLNRNIFDRALSFYFMETTKILHRIEDDQGFFLTTFSDKVIRQEPPDTLHNVNEGRFVLALDTCKKYVLLQERICNKLNHVKINYETMEEDCKSFQIPCSKTNFKKTHSKSYKDKIKPKSWKNISKYNI